MAYSRTARQPKGDNGSCIIDTLPHISLSYGYLKETPDHVYRTSYTTNRLQSDALLYIKESRSFQEFKDYVTRIYTGNPDFVWNPGKKHKFEQHMEQLERGWPKCFK